MKIRAIAVLLIWLMGAFWLTSCSANDASPCGCVPLVLIKDPLAYRQEGIYPVNARPTFDPTGNGQFAYFKGGGNDRPQLTGIWRSSLASPRNGQQLLPGQDFQLQLHWGSRGWLTYNNSTGQVVKLKSNGDSLQQLTSGIAHYQPIWSPDGRKLAVVYNPSNNVYGLGIYDFVTQQLNMVVPIDRSSSTAGMIYGADWLPDSQTMVWASGLGVFKVDVRTGKTVQLRSGCNSRIYLSPSVSPDGQTIIVERNDKQLVNNGTTIRSTNTLWTMNLDGTNERKVEF